MRPKNKFPSGTAKYLETLLQETKDLNEYKRILSIYLRVKFDYNNDLISLITSYKNQTIKNIHSNYLKEGKKSLNVNKRGGRNNEIFSLEEEKELIQEFEKRSKEGGILEISSIHRACQEKANKKIALSTVYRMLDRHNWRKITPRTSHPKSNEKIM
jgi:transposase